MEEQKNKIKNTHFRVKNSPLPFDIMRLKDFLKKSKSYYKQN